MGTSWLKSRSGEDSEEALSNRSYTVHNVQHPRSNQAPPRGGLTISHGGINERLKGSPFANRKLVLFIDLVMKIFNRRTIAKATVKILFVKTIVNFLFVNVTVKIRSVKTMMRILLVPVKTPVKILFVKTRMEILFVKAIAQILSKFNETSFPL